MDGHWHTQPLFISNLVHKILVYLHIIHLLKSSTCFEHYPAHLQEVYVVIIYMHPLVSSLLVYLSCLFSIENFDDWLTVYRSITLVDLQLDAQNSCLFTYNTFIKILCMFRALPCSSAILEAAYMYIYIHIYIYIYIYIYNYDVDLLKMSRVMFETCRGF